MAAITSVAIQYSSSSSLQSQMHSSPLVPSLEPNHDHNLWVRVRSMKSTSQRFSSQNNPKGLTILSAATKQAKSPGTCFRELEFTQIEHIMHEP